MFGSGRKERIHAVQSILSKSYRDKDDEHETVLRKIESEWRRWSDSIIVADVIPVFSSCHYLQEVRQLLANSNISDYSSDDDGGGGISYSSVHSLFLSPSCLDPFLSQFRSVNFAFLRSSSLVSWFLVVLYEMNSEEKG